MKSVVLSVGLRDAYAGFDQTPTRRYSIRYDATSSDFDG